MPKSKVNVVPITANDRWPLEKLVDAKILADQLGFTPDYINRMAKAGKIPWHGIRNGVKVYRRFDPAAVIAALAHDVEEPVPPAPAQRESETRRFRA